MVAVISGGAFRHLSSKLLLALAAVIVAALASPPAGASAEVVKPTAVKPEVVKPQALTPPPTPAPAPAPSSAPAPNRGSGSAPTRSPSPSVEPVGDTPEPRQRPRPAPVPTGEKPPFPTQPDYPREGFPTCIANNTDVEKRCSCDPAWCRFFNEQQAWDRWQREHADDQSGAVKAEKEAAAAADKAAAIAADKAVTPLTAEDFIQGVVTVKEMIERALTPPTAEQKCQCSIAKGGDKSSGSHDYDSRPMGPPEPGVGTATREVADTVAEAAGGISSLFRRLLAE
jgi:hypothetical protein